MTATRCSDDHQVGLNENRSCTAWVGLWHANSCGNLFEATSSNNKKLVHFTFQSNQSRNSHYVLSPLESLSRESHKHTHTYARMSIKIQNQIKMLAVSIVFEFKTTKVKTPFRKNINGIDKKKSSTIMDQQQQQKKKTMLPDVDRRREYRIQYLRISRCRTQNANIL